MNWAKIRLHDTKYEADRQRNYTNLQCWTNGSERIALIPPMNADSPQMRNLLDHDAVDRGDP